MADRQRHSDSHDRITMFGYKIEGWKFQALTAIAATALLGLGTIIGGEYERWRSSSAEQALAAYNAVNAYEALGDVPRRAGEYVATKREGSPEDVRKVARLLLAMMFEIENERYSVVHFQTAVGGRAKYWRIAFAVLFAGQSPASSEFNAGELRAYRALSNDLENLMSFYGGRFESEAVDSAAAAQDGRALPPYR